MPSPGRWRFGPTPGYAIVAVVIAMALLAAIGSRQPDDIAMQTIPDPDRTMLVENFEGLRAGRPWRDGERHGQWRAEYDGYGTTRISTNNGHRLTMSPRNASDPKITHGGLVTTVEEFDDIDVTAQLRTVRQLRSGTPNPWEVAWLLWHYTDDNHFYSVVLKPNGWELGKEDPAYPGSQRFLATGDTPVFRIGMQHTVQVRQAGNSMAVWADGKLLTTYTDHERPYTGGRIGLYTEDAQAEFDSVVVRRL